MQQNILYCDSRGDTRYSPFFCWLEAFGVRDNIENHYQKAKVFSLPDGSLYHPNDWRAAKQAKKGGLPQREDVMRLPNGRFAPARFLVFGWYTSLWLKYLDANPDLIDHARRFDEYVDRFKHGFPMCQADCVRAYVQGGREELLGHCQPFFDWLRSGDEVAP